MSSKRTDSQQTPCAVMLEINGERRQAGSATCSIRPGRGLTFSIDLIEGLEIPDDDMAEMAGMFGGYLMDELNKAKALGIPIE